MEVLICRMFIKDFLTVYPSVEELINRLKAILEKTASWPQGEDTGKLEFIAKDIGKSALQMHASWKVRLLVACIAADILRIFAPDAPYDRTQLQSIFSLLLSSFYQLCNPPALHRALYLLERLVSVKAFSLAASEEVSECMLETLLATVSSICQKGVLATTESLLADCIVDFTEECNESSMSTLLLDTFFEPISTCKNFDTNQNARVFIISLKRSPALQHAASQYLFDLKQKIGIESDLRDSVINIIAAIAPIAPKALTLVMPALADDLKFDDSEVRSKVVSLLGKVFSSTGAYVYDFPELLKEYLGRIYDKIVGIRSSILSVAIDLVKSHPSTMPDVCAVLVAALNDDEEKIRNIALNVVCENFKLLQQSGDATILKEAGKRMRDKKASIRKEAMQLFATIYQKAPAKERDGTYGWIVNTIIGNARDTDSSDVRGEVDIIVDETFLPESSSPSAVFTSVSALIAHLDDAGFAGLEHLLNNKAKIASELRRACVMVCQSGSEHSLLSSCIKNLASLLPESLKAADQLEAVFAYSSIKLAPKLLECLDVVHDTSELCKRKRDLDKKFGPRSSLQDFLDELFIHFQIGLFDCRWMQGLLSSVSAHEISPSATKLTKVVLTSFPKTASACNAIILDCIQNDKTDSSVALRAVHANAESFRGNTKLTNATKQLCASRNHRTAKLASRAFVSLEGQAGAEALVKQMKEDLDVDERCVAALSVLQQCSIMCPMSIMQHAVEISRFVVEKLASASVATSIIDKTSKAAKSSAVSSCQWLAQAKVIGIKLLGILSCCCVKDKPDSAVSATVASSFTPPDVGDVEAMQGAGGGELAAGGDRPISNVALATHLNVTPRHVARLIAAGMPNSNLDAVKAWRERRPPPQRNKGHVKRVREEGELSALQLAVALNVDRSRVHQLWAAGMSRKSVQEALAWREATRRRPVAVSDASDDSIDSSMSVAAATAALPVTVAGQGLGSRGYSGAACVGCGAASEDDVTGGTACEASGWLSLIDSSESASSSDADLMELAGVNAMDLRTRSRNLSGEHSVCPQLMEFCLAGVECWGKFYKSFRPFETKLLVFEPLQEFSPGGSFTHDAYLRLVLAIYRRYHKSIVPGGNTSSKMLERLRQVVGREKRSRAGRVEASEVDKSEYRYVKKLQQSRENTAAVKSGCATEEQARKVYLHRQTDREYADLAIYCHVHEKFDEERYRCFIPDLYKTGWLARQHVADVNAERTQEKVEARRQAALERGIGCTILLRCEVAHIVTGMITATVAQLIDLNMCYIGVTKYTIGSRGFNIEVVRWAAVDGGCLPALTVRNESVPIICKRNGGRQQLEALGFTIQVLYQNVLYCNLRQVETALHVALKDCPNRLWRLTGAGGYKNRPEQIKEQLDQAWLGSVFVAYAPLSLKHNFKFAPDLPLATEHIIVQKP